MAAFAKLFDLDGIGQVLATLESAAEDDDEDRADIVIKFRIEDLHEIEFAMKMHMKTEAVTMAIWDAIDGTTIQATIQPLLDARASIARQQA